MPLVIQASSLQDGPHAICGCNQWDSPSRLLRTQEISHYVYPQCQREQQSCGIPFPRLGAKLPSHLDLRFYFLSP